MYQVLKLRKKMFSSLTHHCIVFNSCNGLIKQQIHYCFKIFIIADVFLHDGDIISVSQELGQQLHGIEFGDEVLADQ